MKKIICSFLSILFICIIPLFSDDTATLVAKGKQQEAKRNYIQAFSYYWDAMVKTPGVDFGAYDSFKNLSQEFTKKIELSDSIDEFEIFDIWTQRLKGFEKYYSSHIPYIFTVSEFYEKSLNYEDKTGNYEFTVKMISTQKYDAIRKLFVQGLENNRLSEWPDMPNMEEWPRSSIYKDFNEALENGVFLIRNLDERYDSLKSAVFSGKTAIDFELYDKKGNYLATPERDGATYSLSNIPLSVMKLIKKNQIELRPVNAFLEYGEYTSPKITKSSYTPKKDYTGRLIIRADELLSAETWEEDNPDYIPKKRKQFDVKKLSIKYPYKKYRITDFNPMNFIEDLEFINYPEQNINVKVDRYDHSKGRFVYNDPVEATVPSFTVSKLPVTNSLYRQIERESEKNAYHLNYCEILIFCNKLSSFFNLEPYYTFNGKTDTSKWAPLPPYLVSDDDDPRNLKAEEKQNEWKAALGENHEANGFRLPCYEELLVIYTSPEDYMYKNRSTYNNEWCNDSGIFREPSKSLNYVYGILGQSLNTGGPYPNQFHIVRNKVD